MNDYTFELLHPNRREPLANPGVLACRPCLNRDRSQRAEAERFVPGEELATAINTALCVGDPLLITGEPGTGKTQTAFYVARALNLGEVLHFQVRSTSVAKDLLYTFDTVLYFQQANLREPTVTKADGTLDKSRFLEKGPLWKAIESARASGYPRVVLIDEIDKAPRDFPNDLLHELDTMDIQAPETGQSIRAEPRERPVVIVTSNSERRLPEPFLRRCVYHHIEFNEGLLRQILESRKDEFGVLSEGLRDLAIERFLSLRRQGLRKLPSTAEFLVWLRVLATAGHLDEASLKRVDLAKLPYLGALVKHHEDRGDLEAQARRR